MNKFDDDMKEEPIPPRRITKRKTITNKMIFDELVTMEDRMLKEQNELVEYTHDISKALEILNDNMAATMLNSKEIIDMLKKLVDDNKRDHQGDYI
jgi:hypothetical protein